MVERGSDTADGEFLTFELDAARYAVPLDQVEEVVRAVASRPLPGAPAVVEGVIDYRGSVVPVLDIRSRFRHQRKPLEPSDHLIIAHTGARRVALRVDRPGWIERVPGDAVASAADVTIGLDHLRGVAALEAGLILLHDLRAFLTDAEAATLGGALSSDAAGG